ncbi:MAG: hypothetical protein ACREJS_09985 [Candidatus Rokuibacteriota bacterium]
MPTSPRPTPHDSTLTGNALKAEVTAILDALDTVRACILPFKRGACAEVHTSLPAFYHLAEGTDLVARALMNATRRAIVLHDRAQAHQLAHPGLAPDVARARYLAHGLPLPTFDEHAEWLRTQLDSLAPTP